jgi:hypothetical protein
VAINIERLVKLLNLTNSTSDNEALNAIRIANKTLKASSLNWEDVLSHKPKIKGFDFSTYTNKYKTEEPPSPPKHEYERGFKEGQRYAQHTKDQPNETDADEIKAVFKSLKSKLDKFGEEDRAKILGILSFFEAKSYLTYKQMYLLRFLNNSR